MKKTTLVAVALSGALAVGAFAHGVSNQQAMMNGQYQQNMQSGQGMMGMMGGQQGMMNGQQRMMGSGMAGNHGANCGASTMGHGMMGSGGMMHGGMQMFSQLNLTSEQQYKLSILRDEMRLEMRKQMHNAQPMGQMGSFFKGDNFNKDAFVKQMDTRHEKMLDLMANNMEKAFKILTKEQRAQLQTNMK